MGRCVIDAKVSSTPKVDFLLRTVSSTDPSDAPTAIPPEADASRSSTPVVSAQLLLGAAAAAEGADGEAEKVGQEVA
jgi:hypothetical protein